MYYPWVLQRAPVIRVGTARRPDVRSFTRANVTSIRYCHGNAASKLHRIAIFALASKRDYGLKMLIPVMGHSCV